MSDKKFSQFTIKNTLTGNEIFVGFAAGDNIQANIDVILAYIADNIVLSSILNNGNATGTSNLIISPGTSIRNSFNDAYFDISPSQNITIGINSSPTTEEFINIYIDQIVIKHVTNVSVVTPSFTKNGVEIATITDVNNAIIGLLDDRGNYNASVNLFPSTGGSGTSGAILKGDLWTISVAGTLGGVAVTVGDVIRALVDTPAQTSSNWTITENNLGYVPENSSNKSTSTSDSASSVKFPVWSAVVSYLNSYVTQTGTETLTNKTVKKRVLSVTQSATPATNIDNADIVSITGLAQAITSMSTNLTGTPYDGQMIMWQFTDNGTARAITWGASFASTTNVTLPTTTVISTMLRVITQYNSVTSKHECQFIN